MVERFKRFPRTKVAMKITLRDIRVERSTGKNDPTKICVLSTVGIHAFGDYYEETNVDLFKFYLTSKTAIFDALLSGIDSDISVDDEPLIALSSANNGIVAKNIMIHNPEFSSIPYEEVGLEDIRQFIAQIETNLANQLAPFRGILIKQFASRGSRGVFDLLKLIDRSNTIRLS